jgi:hypothetical protein
MAVGGDDNGRQLVEKSWRSRKSGGRGEDMAKRRLVGAVGVGAVAVVSAAAAEDQGQPLVRSDGDDGSLSTRSLFWQPLAKNNLEITGTDCGCQPQRSLSSTMDQAAATWVTAGAAISTTAATLAALAN